MSAFVEIGEEVFVKASAIVAIHEGCTEEERARLSVEPYENEEVAAIIALESGHLWPCYEEVATVLKRLAEALDRAP